MAVVGEASVLVKFIAGPAAAKDLEKQVGKAADKANVSVPVKADTRQAEGNVRSFADKARALLTGRFDFGRELAASLSKLSTVGLDRLIPPLSKAKDLAGGAAKSTESLGASVQKLVGAGAQVGGIGLAIGEIADAGNAVTSGLGDALKNVQAVKASLGENEAAAGVLERVADAARSTNRGLGETTDVADDASDAVEGLGVSLKEGLIAAASAAAVALFGFSLQGVHAFARLAEEVDTVQDVLGGTAEDASRLRAAAVALGVDVNTLAGGVYRLSQNLISNKEKLAAFGVEAAKTADGTTDLYGTLIGLSDSYRALSDPQEKNRLLMLAFGRSGRDLEEVLSAGGDRLREFAEAAERAGLVLDDAGVKKGKEYNIAVRQLSESVKGLQITLGSGLVPVITDVAEGLSVLVDKGNQVTRVIGGLGTVFRVGLAVATGGASEGLRLLARGHESAAEAALKHAAAEKIAAEETEAAEKSATALAGLPAAIEAVDKARAAATDTTVNARRAEEGLARAQQRVADLQEGFAEQAAAAKEDYAEKVVESNQEIAEAEEDLARVQIEAAQSVADAERQASEDIIEARRRTLDAGRNLSDLALRQKQAGNPELLRAITSAQELADATRAVQDARQNERNVAVRSADAVAKARADAAEKIADAEKQVSKSLAEQNELMADGVRIGELSTSQQRQMRDAVKDVSDAEADLAKAREDDFKANEANLRALAKAQADLIVQIREANGETLTQVEKNMVFREQLDKLAQTVGPDSPLSKGLVGLSALFGGLGTDIGAVQEQIDKLQRSLAAGLPESNADPGAARASVLSANEQKLQQLLALLDLLQGGGRAGGGPVIPGYSYTVGEDGPERLDMFRNGRGMVTPLTTTGGGADLIQAIRSLSTTGGSAFSVGQVVVQGATIPAAYANGQEVVRALRSEQYRRTGR